MFVEAMRVAGDGDTDMRCPRALKLRTVTYLVLNRAGSEECIGKDVFERRQSEPLDNARHCVIYSLFRMEGLTDSLLKTIAMFQG